MTTLQTKFLQFHDKIKLRNIDEGENAKLREKRDILLEDLKSISGTTLPSSDKKIYFTSFDQGSYAMKTGILPLDDDYDIDEGLIFALTRQDINPIELKKIVYKALDKNNRTVDIKYPCVRVTYERTKLHVDFAIYASEGNNLFLARGKENSKPSKVEWEPSDPNGLISWVSNIGQSSDEKKQFRRCVRYLKKWKQVKFTNGFMPASIGLTILAGQFFQYFPDNDLAALFTIVSNIKNMFIADKITVQVPVAPWTDIFNNYTDNQFADIKRKINDLYDALDNVRNEESLKIQCDMLIQLFGEDFPVIISEEKQAEKVPCPFIVSGDNA